MMVAIFKQPLDAEIRGILILFGEVLKSLRNDPVHFLRSLCVIFRRPVLIQIDSRIASRVHLVSVYGYLSFVAIEAVGYKK